MHQSLKPLDRSINSATGGGDEDFWFSIQQAYDVDRSFINLNNGAVSPTPRVVFDAMRRHLEFTNQLPGKYLWDVLDPRVETVREGLARILRCDPEEIALTRNASESMEICLLGIELQRGDEILVSRYDYPRMLSTLRQRERREGIVVKQFDIPTPSKSAAQLADLYRAGISPRTKLILLPHMNHYTGEIMPVAEVVKMGRERGIPVVVDGAHSFAHFVFGQNDLDCDYFGTSLHKWLGGPIGTGMLFVRRSKIGSLWALMAAENPTSENIRKFEEIGTRHTAPFLAVAEAIAMHDAIGGQRKAARLKFLRDRWANSLARHERVHFYTNLDDDRSCGIATFGIEGVPAKKLAAHLFEKHRIFVATVEVGRIDGIRITPNLYITLPEIDRFVEVMEHILTDGLGE